MHMQPLEINSVAIEIHQQHFIASQLSLNPLARQVAALIKASQDNQWKKKKIHSKKIHTKNTDKLTL